jgi:hypothetical protein
MKRTLRVVLVFVAATCAALPCSSTALADPLPGRDRLKFQQRPLDNLTYDVGDPVGGFSPRTYWGHDELSTAYGSMIPGAGPPIYVGRFMADDFADPFNLPVLHIKWWGSYLHLNPDFPVNKFLISFESDVPANPSVPGSFSHPGQPLLNQVVSRGPIGVGSGTFSEKLVSAGGPPLNEALYEYNAELGANYPFPEQRDTVYWLKIVALVDAPGVVVDPSQPLPPILTQWGWHNRDYTKMDPYASTAPAVDPGEKLVAFLDQTPGVPVYHFQDDAVTGAVTVDFTPTPVGPFPRVIQDPIAFQPTQYVNDVDGPGPFPFGIPGIGSYSKDLAFELYTVVPEPTGWMLAVAALLPALGRRR